MSLEKSFERIYASSILKGLKRKLIRIERNISLKKVENSTLDFILLHFITGIFSYSLLD